MRLTSIKFFMTFWGVCFYLSGPVLAHDVIPGVTGFAGRILHPFIITEHLFCLLLAALIAGLYGSRLIWISIGLLIAGTISGFLSQAVIPIIDWLWMLPLGMSILAGLMVLGAVPLGARLWSVLIFALGFAVGLETDPEGALFIDKANTLGGLVIAGGIIILLIGWPLQQTERPWIGILARVFSSWIVAIALLVLALSF